MLDILNSIIRDAGQEAVVQNPKVPNHQNEAVMQEAQGSVLDSLKTLYQQQGSSGLLSLFRSAEANDVSNPAMQQVSGNFVDRITNKLGISKGTAMSIAAVLIPIVMRKLLHRGRQGGGGGFDLGGLLGAIMGGGGALGGMLGGLGGSSNAAPQAGGLSGLSVSLGLDRDGDGDTDLKDLMAMFGR